MNEVLKRILAEKKREVHSLRDMRSRFGGRTSEPRSFSGGLRNKDRLSIISEVKKASPSKGVICENFDPVNIASIYKQGGADAISVLTDSKFFQGHWKYLVDVRESVNLPVLRKDFIIDTLQVEQSAALDADAILLIVAALDDHQLFDLYQAASDLRMEQLIEIHTLPELERAMKLDPSLLGINNRDLTTFNVDIDVTLRLIKHIPSEVTVISESGISTVDESVTLRSAGVNGLLVGETLMRSNDPASMIRKLSLNPGA
ncbi:indole-3-glycerol phosphate synthase TrpC [Chitinispirillales bacterium ANBcel5]|uniref:indole-3-glycerol phosphate synthase TrpC n=1 Tax=Cellulosispirillum alkaliphilum TaxID=3039283 RepID=UPI002A550CD2|nr:indole-3-glycerol phosphate synthase TrpC [Chitinispirillales bacterium ANBcel5]